MNIEYREPTEEEMNSWELAQFVESAERHFEDIAKDTIGSEFEANFRGLNDDDYVLVAYDADAETFAGVVILDNCNDIRAPFVLLDNLYVKWEYRRHGIGGELVKRAVSVAREAGKKVVLSVLSQNDIGRKFWGKFNFLKPYFAEYIVDYDEYDAEAKKC